MTMENPSLMDFMNNRKKVIDNRKENKDEYLKAFITAISDIEKVLKFYKKHINPDVKKITLEKEKKCYLNPIKLLPCL